MDTNMQRDLHGRNYRQYHDASPKLADHTVLGWIALFSAVSCIIGRIDVP
jgi:hypothetical protein